MLKRETRVKISSFPIKLDLGCKDIKREGFVGLDAYDFGQDVLWDINCGLPFPDDSVIEVFCNQFFEHLTEAEINVLCWELYRVCVDGAMMEIRVPHQETEVAYDIAHYSLWSETRFRGLFNSMGCLVERAENHEGDLRVWVKIKK